MSASHAVPTTIMDKRMLSALVCPTTLMPLEYDAENQVLISRAAKLVFPIQDGVPILVPDEATPLEGEK